MNHYSQYAVHPLRMDDEDEKPKEENAPETKALAKKMEKIFFEKRALYLWGVVDDKSARDIVTKLILLDNDKPGEEIKFYINSPGGVVTSGMVIYDTMKTQDVIRHEVGHFATVRTMIGGRAHRTGYHRFVLDPADAVGLGFQLR